MILISHRGNIDTINLDYENKPAYIETALNLNYFVEVDLWAIDNKLFLGHDNPLYEINENFINNKKIYIHCKNKNALEFLNSNAFLCNYFWHQSDEYTITSNNKIWVHVGKPLIPNSICCLPEQYDTMPDLSECYGICSDYIANFK